MLRRHFCAAFMAMGLMTIAGTADAMTNSQLARKSMLKISNAMAGSETLLTTADFSNLPVVKLNTSTPWTDGNIEFEGVYIKDLVHQFGSNTKQAQATAFNDYQIQFDLADAIAKDAFVAYKRDGEFMSRRDKGPFWIIFPWTDRPELDTRAVHGLSIWQLVNISFN